MKKAILAILWVAGLCLAGADVTGGFGYQMVTCTAGVLIFAVSSLLLIKEINNHG
jgi:hypothetical protein